MKKLKMPLLIWAVLLLLPGCSGNETGLKPDDFPSFSYQEATEIWKKDEPGVCYDGFQNMTEAELTDADSIIERAKKECTVAHDTAAISGYDRAEDMWMIVFSTSGTLGGCQTVYMDGRGITHLIVYGE